MGVVGVFVGIGSVCAPVPFVTALVDPFFGSGGWPLDYFEPAPPVEAGIFTETPWLAVHVWVIVIFMLILL